MPESEETKKILDKLNEAGINIPEMQAQLAAYEKLKKHPKTAIKLDELGINIPQQLELVIKEPELYDFIIRTTQPNSIEAIEKLNAAGWSAAQQIECVLSCEDKEKSLNSYKHLVKHPRVAIELNKDGLYFSEQINGKEFISLNNEKHKNLYKTLDNDGSFAFCNAGWELSKQADILVPLLIDTNHKDDEFKNYINMQDNPEAAIKFEAAGWDFVSQLHETQTAAYRTLASSYDMAIKLAENGLPLTKLCVFAANKQIAYNALIQNVDKAIAKKNDEGINLEKQITELYEQGHSYYDGVQAEQIAAPERAAIDLPVKKMVFNKIFNRK